jgi:hypothetical protein
MWSPAAARPILKLPSEIRNHIYGYCTPINGHVRDYYGLLLSCKRIHIEYEGEVVGIISKLLDEVKRAWHLIYATPLRTSMPTCLGDMANITVELPKSLYDRPSTYQTLHPDNSDPKLEPAVPCLLQLHLTELNITYYKDAPDSAGSRNHWAPPCEFARDIYMWYYGGANNVRTRFSAQHLKPALPTRKPLHTRLVTIKWVEDDESDTDLEHLYHLASCRPLRILANSDMVEDWKCDPDGSMCFWMNVAG